MIKRILLVDDDPVSLEVMAAALRELDCEVLTAEDGDAALQVLASAQHLPLGVLTDLKMPSMDGLTLLSRLRDEYPNLPAAVVSGHGSFNSTISALQNGAVDFIVKPATVACLRAVLERFEDLFSKYTASLRSDGLLCEKFARYVVKGERKMPRMLSRIVASETQSWIAGQPVRIVQMQMAVLEALENALVHGNLGVSSASRDEDFAGYLNTIAERLSDPVLRARTVTVEVKLGQQELEISVQDEGAGFEPGNLPTVDSIDVLQTHGRGIFLIRNFFDDVSWEHGGRLIKMSKSIGTH